MSESHKEDSDVQETEFGGGSRSTKRRVIYFSSGETLEEDDDEDEEEEDEDDDSSNGGAFREPSQKVSHSWKNLAILVWRRSLRTCDFLGGRMASLLGLNTAKYQYAIDLYHHEQKVTNSQAADDESGERGSERISLSSRPPSGYGATSTVRRPADHEASDDKKPDVSKGSHNRGFEEDDEDH